jgi:hypothetical protein
MESLNRDALFAAGTLLAVQGVRQLLEQPDESKSENVSIDRRLVGGGSELEDNVWINRPRHTLGHQSANSSLASGNSTCKSDEGKESVGLSARSGSSNSDSGPRGRLSFTLSWPLATNEWTSLPSSFGDSQSIALQEKLLELGAAEFEICLGAYLMRFATQTEQELLPYRGPYGAIPHSRDMFNLSMKWKGDRYRHIYRLVYKSRH